MTLGLVKAGAEVRSSGREMSHMVSATLNHSHVTSDAG